MIAKTTFIVMIAAFSMTAHAGIHKWVDKDGVVHFGDHPPQNTKTEQLGPAVNIVKGEREPPSATELEDAVGKGDAAQVKLLLSEGATVSQSALAAAARANEVDILEQLLDAREQAISTISPEPGALSNSMRIYHNQLLSTAVGYDADRVVRFLAGRGANIEGAGMEPLLIQAVRRGYVRTAKALLDSGADVNAKKSWALRLAAEGGDAAMVQALLRSGADINAVANGHHPAGPPLADATRRGHTAVVDMLRAYGAQ